MFRGKVIVIGAGNVGSTCAYTIMLGGSFSEIVLIDIDRGKAEGDALDMSHSAAFLRPVSVYAGDYPDCKNADIIIIAAGANQKQGETRLDLLKRNAAVFKSVIAAAMKYAPSDVILMPVTNPVDILTYASYRLSGLPKRQVIGSGTVLDTSRLKYLISRHTGVDARDCNTYIIGEHGDSEAAAWSVTNIAGMSMQEFFSHTGKCTDEDLRGMYDEVKNSAYRIIEKKGATYYGIAAAVARICECIAGNENSVLTVSTVLGGEYGIDEVSLSVPVQLSGIGVEQILEIPIDAHELALLHKSADIIRENINSLNCIL